MENDNEEKVREPDTASKEPAEKEDPGTPEASKAAEPETDGMAEEDPGREEPGKTGSGKTDSGEKDPEKKETDQKDPDQKNSEKNSDQKGSDKKDSDKKNSDQKGSDKNPGKQGQGRGEPGTASQAKESSPQDDSKGLFGRKKKDKRDQQIEDLTDRCQRQMAEFDNFRKRTEKEKSAMFEMGERAVLEKILPTVDNFERGLSGLSEEKKEDAFAQGMEKVYRQLVTALEGLGVTPIEAVGQTFDPNFHNAVQHVEDEEAGENIVVEEFQKGYMYRDSVLRHSMVKVAN